jgi:hypothetical protein
VEDDTQKKSSRKSTFPKSKLLSVSENVPSMMQTLEIKSDKKRLMKGQNKENIRVHKFEKDLNKENNKPLSVITL